MYDCVIIGGGAAGIQAARSCRQRWPDKTIAVIDTESQIGYYRTLIPQFINRSMTEDKLFFLGKDADPQFEVISGISVERIDRHKRTISLSNGVIIYYQRLIIASGGRPVIPPVCSVTNVQGIFPVRGLSTARAARDWIVANPRIVILGGGLVGVKTAVHLAGFNHSITLVEKEHQLLPLSLSTDASRLVEEHLQSKNINLLLGNTIDEIHVEDGRLQSVTVNGNHIPCQTLFVAAGSLPELGFLKDSGLLREGRLTVSSTLQTVDTAIFAAGDVVTIDDNGIFTPWTWPQAVIQGRCAGENVFAPVPRSLTCFSRVNAMNLNGLSLVILGNPVQGAQRVCLDHNDSASFRELYLRDQRIVGGSLIGDISNCGELHQMMIQQVTLDEPVEDVLIPHHCVISNRSLVFPNYKRQATILTSQGA